MGVEPKRGLKPLPMLYGNVNNNHTVCETMRCMSRRVSGVSAGGGYLQCLFVTFKG